MKIRSLLLALLACSALPHISGEPIPAVRTFSLGDTEGDGKGAQGGSVDGKLMVGDGAKNQQFRGFIVFDIEKSAPALEAAKKVTLQFSVEKKFGAPPETVRVETLATADRNELFSYLFDVKRQEGLTIDANVQPLEFPKQPVSVDVTSALRYAAARSKNFVIIRLSPVDFSVIKNAAGDQIQFVSPGSDSVLDAPSLVVE